MSSLAHFELVKQLGELVCLMNQIHKTNEQNDASSEDEDSEDEEENYCDLYGHYTSEQQQNKM